MDSVAELPGEKPNTHSYRYSATPICSITSVQIWFINPSFDRSFYGFVVARLRNEKQKPWLSDVPALLLLAPNDESWHFVEFRLKVAIQVAWQVRASSGCKVFSIPQALSWQALLLRFWQSPQCEVLRRGETWQHRSGLKKRSPCWATLQNLVS